MRADCFARSPLARATPQFSASTFQRVLPEEFHARFLSMSVRADGRGMSACRTPRLQVGVIDGAAGSAMVRLEATTFLAVVTAQVGAPPLGSVSQAVVLGDEEGDDAGTAAMAGDQPSSTADAARGHLVINVDLPAVCHSKYSPGKPSVAAQLLTRRLTELVSACELVDATGLVAVPGRVLWILHVDVICLCDDGGLFDAALLALLGALRSARLPELSLASDGAVLRSAVATRPLPLASGCLPVALTMVRLGEYAVADPSAEEEALATHTTSVVVDACAPTHVLALQSQGRAPLAEPELGACLAAAAARASSLRELLESL